MYLSRPNEPLENHIDFILYEYEIINKFKGIDKIINNIINKLCSENKYLNNQSITVKSILMDTFKFHDEGKKNPYFQSYIGNELFKKYKYSKINKHHSEISAVYYLITMYDKYLKNIKNPIQNGIKDLVISFAYNIYRHHSDLKNFDKSNFIDNMIDYYEDNKELFINIDLTNIDYLYKFKSRGNIKYNNEYTYYLLCKLSYSLLITCDFMSVYRFNNINNESLGINIIDSNIKDGIYNKFNSNKVINSIRQFQINPNYPLSKLNKYRTEMFLESEVNTINYKNKSNIYYLEAPTGCGKSLTSLNIAYNLLDDTVNKIYYVAPFNNIAEQTHKVIKESFYEDVVTVNSRESIFTSGEDDDFNDYDGDYLNYQMINYPISLISHVKFFDILFSNKRMSNLMLSSLCNSVIIIDEIQSYKNKLWIHIVNSLKEFADILNLKIIIMSATLPKMDCLLDNAIDSNLNYQIPELINNRDYYYNFFKKRVEFDFSLLRKDKNTEKEIFDKIDDVISNTHKHRILIECLTTKTADNFYNEMKKYEKDGFVVFKMTGNTNQINREFIIKTIQNKINNKYKNDKIILIGTQCIEAGVDIDMQVGFKDISILDADEQFSGRIERNFNDTGIVYFFDIDDGNFIYKGDYRTEYNLKNDEWKTLFENKEFNKFYDRNYKWLLEKENNKYIEYKNSLKHLQYEDIYDIMNLIDSKTYSFLFICKYQNKESAFDLYNEYKNINNKYDIGYSEKQIKLKQIQKQLGNYMYNINSYKFKNDICLENIGGIYIVENAEQYFDNIIDGELSNKSCLDLESFVSYVGLFL